MTETSAGEDEADEMEIDRLDELSEGRYTALRRSSPRGGWCHALAYLVNASTEAALATGASEERAVALAMTISSFGACALKDALSGVDGGGATAIAKKEREVKLFLAHLQVAALSACLRGGVDTISSRWWWWRRIKSWFGGRAPELSLGKELVIGPLCKNCLRLSDK